MTTTFNIDGISYKFEFRNYIGYSSMIMIERDNIVPYYRSIIDGKLDWSCETQLGRTQTPLQVRCIVDKLVANRAFL